MSQKILVIRSSIKNDGGFSGQLVDYFLDQLKEVIPESSIVVRDIAKTPIAHLNANTMAALYGREPSDDEGRQALSLSNELIEEINEADRIVIGLPRYNFGAPSLIHAYIDQLVISGVTFTYNETGPVGLIDSKPVYVLTASGGIYSNGPDTLALWLSQILGFIGLTQIKYVYAEGLGMGEESLAKGLKQARHEIDQAINELGERPRLKMVGSQGR